MSEFPSDPEKFIGATGQDDTGGPGTSQSQIGEGQTSKPEEMQADLGSVKTGAPEEKKEKELSPETLSEPERVAYEKLEALLSPEFKNFAIRFMNREEYHGIIKRGGFQDPTYAEATVFKGRSSFREFLSSVQGDEWARVAGDMTLWENSCVNLNVYNGTLEAIRRAHKQAQEAGSENVRIEAMRYLRPMLLKIIENSTPYDKGLRFVWDYDRIQSDLEEIPKQLESVIGKELDDELMVMFEQITLPEGMYTYTAPDGREHRVGNYNWGNYIKDKISPHVESENDRKLVYELFRRLLETKKTLKGDRISETTNFQIIREFMSNEHFLNAPDNLRKIVNAIAYMPAQIDLSHKQYHIAVVFDLDIVDFDNKQWMGHQFKPSIDSLSFGDNVLGAIALMPDKELVQEMVMSNQRSGRLAHPIFDRNGVVRYPAMSR